jgi:hypothetical protein
LPAIQLGCFLFSQTIALFLSPWISFFLDCHMVTFFTCTKHLLEYFLLN